MVVEQSQVVYLLLDYRRLLVILHYLMHEEVQCFQLGVESAAITLLHFCKHAREPLYVRCLVILS